MSVYLGTFGRVELQRQFEAGELVSIVNTSDVNVTRKRFSFDFQHGQLLTGDQVEIKSTNGAKAALKSFCTLMTLMAFGFMTLLLMQLMEGQQMQPHWRPLLQPFLFRLKLKAMILDC